MSRVFADETNYERKTTEKPNYQLFRISQQSGGTSVTLSASGGEQSVFEIPSNVLNFSRSVISFDAAIGQLGGALCGALYLAGTVPAIRDFEIYTQNGTRLLFIPNIHKYLQVSRKTDTKLEDFMTSTNNGLERTNKAGTTGRNYRFPAASDAATTIATARTYHGNAADAYPLEPGYTSVCDFIQSALDTAISYNFRIDLSEIKNTIAELDKDLYFRGEIIYARITWASLSQVGCQAGTANTLAAQAATAAIPITNLYMYLAVEKNEVLANQVKEQVMTKGLNVLVDYVHAHNQNLTGTSHSLSQRFSRAHGRTLKKVYSIPYIASDTNLSNYYNHHFDQANEAILNMYTMLNNERLQQWNMITANGDEYMVMKDILKGSAIQMRDQFLAYYFFVDTFDNLRLHEREPNVLSGLSLDQEQKYDILATTEAARNWYSFAVCQRMLMIGPDEIKLD